MIAIAQPGLVAPKIRTILENAIAELAARQIDPEDEGKIVALCSYLYTIIRNGRERFKPIICFEVENSTLINAHVLGEDSGITIVPLTITSR